MICLRAPIGEAPCPGPDTSHKSGSRIARFGALVEQFLSNEAFRDQARRYPHALTRHRKVGLIGVLSIILNMVRKTTQVELDDYRERILPGGETMTYTKQSFAEARQNLRPEAFVLLNNVFLQGYYADGDDARYHGFRLLAVDGSVLELPNTPALQAYYGTSENHSPHGTLARARSSTLYDLLNGLVIHTILGRYDRGERDMAREHLLALAEITPADTPNLVLFDRGYPSADFILWLRAHHIHFVMRVAQGFYSEIQDVTESDAHVTIRITQDRARHLREQGTPVPVGTEISLRVLKVILPSGDVETLISDLTPTELPHAEAAALYFRRWGLETHFDDLKHKFEVENFSGHTPVVVAQDFYATTFLGNMAAVVEEDAEAAAQERLRNSSHSYKYEEYRVNRNLLVGTIKHRLIKALLEPDGAQREQAFHRLIQHIQRALIPVRRGRTAPRDKRKRANKYSQNRRRSL